MEKRKPLCTVVGNVKWSTQHGETVEVLQKIKNTIRFRNSTSGNFLKQTKSLILKDICIPHIVAALLMKAKIRKQLKCSLRNGRTETL